MIKAHARDELGIDLDEMSNPLQVSRNPTFISQRHSLLRTEFSAETRPVCESVLFCCPCLSFRVYIKVTGFHTTPA